MSILKSLEIWTMKQRAKGVAVANASTDETLIPQASGGGGGGGVNEPGLKDDANAALQADELEIAKVNEGTLEAAVAEVLLFLGTVSQPFGLGYKLGQGQGQVEKKLIS
jgi:hypothetical protein